MPATARLFVGPREDKKTFNKPNRENWRFWSNQGSCEKDVQIPILSLAKQLPRPLGRGLDEHKKAGLLTSRSSYQSRLTALSHSGFMRSSSLVTAALPHRTCTCFPILL